MSRIWKFFAISVFVAGMISLFQIVFLSDESISTTQPLPLNLLRLKGELPSETESPSHQRKGPARKDIESRAESQAALRIALKSEAEKMNGRTEFPEQDQERLQGIANHLTMDEAKILRDLVLDNQQTQNLRFVAVYLLGLRPADFQDLLRSVAVSEIPPSSADPHSSAGLRHDFEGSLRIEALSALDQLNSLNSPQPDFFAEMGKRQKDPVLRQLAYIGYQGSLKGQSLIRQYLENHIKGAIGESEGVN